MKQFKQSPININSYNTYNKDKEIKFNYNNTCFKVMDNNINIVLIPLVNSNYIEVQNQIIHLTEIHFHRPSEHYINNNSFDMEVHLVHQQDHFTIVYGVLLKIENYGMDFGCPFSNINKEICFNLNLLLENTSCYQYYGSFTTKPYDETVIWVVNKMIMPFNRIQAELLSSLYPNNNRCLQVCNDRKVYNINIINNPL